MSIKFVNKGKSTSDATATADDILNPKTAYVNNQKIVGNIIGEYKTTEVTEYKGTQLSQNINTKNYNASIEISGFIFMVSNNNSTLYFDIIKDDNLIKHLEYDASDLGLITNIQGITLTYDKIENGNIDIVLGVINNTKTSSQTIITTCNFIKFLFSTDTYSLKINSDVVTNAYSKWIGNYSSYAPSLVADIENRNIFYILSLMEDWGLHTQCRIISVTWNNDLSGSTTNILDERIVNGNWYGSNFGITGDNTYLSFARGILKVNSARTSFTKKDIGSAIYLSHNMNYMVTGNSLYKVTAGKTIDEIYNSREAIGTQLPSYNSIIFSQNDNYMILITSNAFSIYRIEDDELILAQTITRTGIYTSPWNSNYILSNESGSKGINFYNCSGEEILKSLATGDNKYIYIETSDVPASTKVLNGVKYLGTNGSTQYGTMPNNNTLNYIPSDTAQTIPAGYTSGGTISSIDTSEEYTQCLELTESILE